MAYSPKFEDVQHLMTPEELSYTPSMEDVPKESLFQRTSSNLYNLAAGSSHSLQAAPDYILRKLGFNAKELPLGGVGLAGEPDTSSKNYKLGDIGTSLGEFYLGAGVIDELLGLPKVAGALSGLPGVLGKAAPTTAKMLGYGAVGAGLTPQHPLIGGALGATGVIAGALAGKAVEAISNLDAPQYAKMVMQKLFKGSGTDENRVILGKMIKDQSDKITGIKNQNYSNVFDQLEQQGGGNTTFPKTAQAWQTLKRRYPDSAPKISTDLAEDTDSFLNPNPINNNPLKPVRDANLLKGRLGEKAYKLTGFGADSVERNLGGELFKVKNTLKSEILNHVQQFGLEPALTQADTYYMAHYLPYVSARNIFKIAKGAEGDENVVNNPSLLFSKKSPVSEEDVTDKDFKNIGLAMIAEHGGDEFKNRILGAVAGAARNDRGNVDSEKLLDSLSKLDNKGLIQYLTPDAKSMIDTLHQKLKPGFFGAVNPLQQAEKILPRLKPWAQETIYPTLSDIAKKIKPSDIQKASNVGTGGVLGFLKGKQ
jgi:hypothetical protein